MQYTTIPAAMISHNIASLVETQVQEKTGMQLTAVQYPTEEANTTPQRMLHVIALALQMSPECFRMKTRARNIVELRFIASLMLRRYFPALSLQQIGRYFGGQDHTSVMHAISRAHSLIYVRDAEFIKKYNMAIKSVSSWLRKDALGCA